MTRPCTAPRRLGDLSVGAVGLGCMNLSHAYGIRPSDVDAERLLNAALDQGVTLLDTAALYGFGANEELIAKTVGHRRREYILSSKCVLFGLEGKRTLDGTPQSITTTLDAALRRLNTDFIDLYYLHRLDRRVPVEDSVGALVRAREAGKIGAIGLSEMGAETIRRANAEHRISAVQSEYSLMVRNPEIAVLDTCAELDIGFVAFSPLARGLLAGAVRDDHYVAGDIRRGMPRFLEPHLTHNLIAIERFCALASEVRCSPAQLALAWLLSRGDNVVAIPGTRSRGHLADNLATVAVPIGADDLARAEQMFASGAVRGARYADAVQAEIDTEQFADELNSESAR